MKCDHTIALILSLSTICTVYSADNCCINARVKTSRTCDDGKPILPKCDSSRSLLNNGWSYYSRYKIHNDSFGEYLENFVGGYIVRTPHFCIGKRKHILSNGTDEVAVICFSQRERYRDLNITIDDSDNEENFLSYYTLVDAFLNFLSCTLLAIAFYVYYLVIPIRQIEDDCLVNFAGSLTITHTAFLYDIVSGGVLPDMCITSLYLMYYFTLSGFSWYALFMFYLWKKYQTGVSLEQATVQKQFRIIAYGAPALLMIFVNIHAHVSKLYTENKFELDCITHQILLEDIYVFAPLILAIGSNCFFWQSLEKHSKTTAIKTTEDDCNKKKINSMLTLNRRLFLALGLPWLAYIIINGSYEIIESSAFGFLGLLTEIGTSSAGGIVALILVMSRARVWKCVTHKYERYEWLQKWQPSDQEEISALTDNGSFNVSRTFRLDV